MTDLMPKPTEPIAGPGGLITRSWRDYLRRFAAATSLAEVWEAIAKIRAQLADQGAGSFLPTTTQVTGRNSVRTDGTLSGGVVLVQLQGDVQNPAATNYYGTDADGARGYHDHALATLSDADVTTVPPVAGDLLRFDGAVWVPDTLALDDLSDVDAPAPNPGDVLTFDGADWVPGTAAASGGVLPLTTGEIAGDQPVFVYGPDGRLIYAPVT